VRLDERGDARLHVDDCELGHGLHLPACAPGDARSDLLAAARCPSWHRRAHLCPNARNRARLAMRRSIAGRAETFCSSGFARLLRLRAYRSERPHNPLVPGSNPGGPTQRKRRGSRHNASSDVPRSLSVLFDQEAAERLQPDKRSRGRRSRARSRTTASSRSSRSPGIRRASTSRSMLKASQPRRTSRAISWASSRVRCAAISSGSSS
jgi:hypothetical protein